MSGHLSNLSGLSGRFCRVSPHLTLLRSTETVRLGLAVSGSRVTFAAERESEREGQSSALGQGLIVSKIPTFSISGQKKRPLGSETSPSRI
uniref:Uncharacterized protein n=1 Tax=Chrysemys picta bellii TaxID=8478 RepID=A0A8C3F7D3_CHRPI